MILDNCEHVIGVVARVTQDLLESCPNLRICTTSREGLAVPSKYWSPVSRRASTGNRGGPVFIERASVGGGSL